MSALGLEVIAACVAGMGIVRVLSSEKHALLRMRLLTLLSALVLAYWQPLGLLVTLVLAAVTWAIIRRLDNAEPEARKRWVTAGMVFLVGALAAFKYTPWLVSLAGERPGHWLVPLGLSFTVFRLIGVLMDAAALNTPVTGDRFLFLTLFFPTLRSGPITTLASVKPVPPGAEPVHGYGAACSRIMGGLFRKVVLADTLHALVISPWLTLGVAHLSPAQCVVLPVLFGLHVYWDFSGYTDIAIGTAALLGYQLPENFNRPYLSGNLVEFWRRWHITLSEWIRTRLFMKMVGRRSPKWQMYVATFVSMVLCGLWHGAGFNFIAWGVWHGAGVVAVNLFGEGQRRSDGLRKLRDMPGASLVSTILTFAYVTIGWCVFFLPFGQAVLLWGRALTWRPDASLMGVLPVLTWAGLAVAGALCARPPQIRTPILRGAIVSAAAAVLVYFLLFHQLGAQEFIYSQF